MFSLLRQGTFAFTSNGLTLGLTVITGVLAARLLGTAGRGELTAILTVTSLIGWAFTFGCGQAAEYHQARHPEDGARLMGTWLALLIVLSTLAVLAAELILPVLFASQTPGTLRLAQLYVLSTP